MKISHKYRITQIKTNTLEISYEQITTHSHSYLFLWNIHSHVHTHTHNLTHSQIYIYIYINTLTQLFIHTITENTNKNIITNTNKRNTHKHTNIERKVVIKDEKHLLIYFQKIQRNMQSTSNSQKMHLDSHSINLKTQIICKQTHKHTNTLTHTCKMINTNKHTHYLPKKTKK